MTVMTWLAIVVLGPGAIALFIWFLRDARNLLRPSDEDGSTPPAED